MLVSLGLVAFGLGQGIVYYAALYYAMAVGRAGVDIGASRLRRHAAADLETARVGREGVGGRFARSFVLAQQDDVAARKGVSCVHFCVLGRRDLRHEVGSWRLLAV